MFSVRNLETTQAAMQYQLLDDELCCFDRKKFIITADE